MPASAVTPAAATPAVPDDRWISGASYDAYMGRWSRVLSAAFVAALRVPPGRRWLDVGCGTGALTETIVREASPASVVACDRSPDLLAHARHFIGPTRVAFAVADAMALPVRRAAFDAVVANLVVNFVPDPAACLAELAAVAAPRAIVAATVWDYASGMQYLRRFWDVASQLDPAARPLDEALRFPFADPGALVAAFRAAGLREVARAALEVPTVFRDFDDYWQPLLAGVGPAPAYVHSLSEAQRTVLAARLARELPTLPDGSIQLRARAWLVRGRVA